MAMLPAGFTQFSTQGSYEQGESVPTDRRGPPPKHNAEGFKQMHASADDGAYAPLWNDAAKGSEAVHGDKNESQADKQTSLAIVEPAAYSRDWSGK